MSFEVGVKVDEALISSIQASIVERKAAICDTWDPVKVMSLPWGVKAAVAPEVAEEVSSYFESIIGKKIDCGNDTSIKVLKAGVKERKGAYTLIFRYQIV